jgi:hypothetical protein
MSDAPPIDTRAIRKAKAVEYHSAVRFLPQGGKKE